MALGALKCGVLHPIKMAMPFSIKICQTINSSPTLDLRGQGITARISVDKFLVLKTGALK